MKNKTVRRGFTLAELIMAIALLALFSVFIVQMFAKADQLAKKARNLDQAVACASNLADGWRIDATEDIPAAVLDLRSNRAVGKTAVIPLDTHFQICEPAQADYQAVLILQPAPASSDPQAAAAASGLWQLSIVIGKVKPTDSAPVYTLKTSRYFPVEVAAP
jgi:prepilin-type N-terminal cleavage/methylation domain-containing protein